MADEVKPVPPQLEPPKKTEVRDGSTLAIFSGVVCLTIGLWLGRYTGPYPLIPLITGVLIGWPFAKLSKGKRKALSPAFAVHAGQFAFVFGYIVFVRMPGTSPNTFVMPEGIWSFFLDLIFLGIASAWIIVAPSLLIVVSLGGYQIIMLIINAIQRSYYGDAAIGSWPATSLSVQIVFRFVCLVVLAMAVWQLQKLHSEERAVNPLHVS